MFPLARFLYKKKKSRASSAQNKSEQQQEQAEQNATFEAFFCNAGDKIAAEGQYNSAVVLYDQAVELAPRNADVLTARSTARMLSSPPQLDQALADAMAAVSLNENHGQAWLQKARLHQRKGETVLARDAFEKAARHGVGETRVSAQIALTDIDSRASLPSTTKAQRPALQPTMTATATTITTIATASQNSTHPPTMIDPAPNPTKSPHLVSPSPISTSAPAASISSSARPSEPVKDLVVVKMTEEMLRISNDGTSLYSPDLTSLDDLVSKISAPELIRSAIWEGTNKLNNLGEALQEKTRGSIAVRKLLVSRGRQHVKSLYFGVPREQITDRELPTQLYLEKGFTYMHVFGPSYPGTTYFDQDPEVTRCIDAASPGTLTVTGFNEEYLQQQYAKTPRTTTALQRQHVLPEFDLTEVATATLKLSSNPALEDDVTLAKFLGLSSAGTTRQEKIKNICSALNKSLFAEPSRFKDFRNVRNISTQFLSASGMGTRNFLFQIQLGAEILVRLRSDSTSFDYTECFTDKVSVLLVVTDLFHENIIMNLEPTLRGTPGVVFYSQVLSTQAAALIRFAEELRWPYVDEARSCIETLCSNWKSGIKVGLEVGDDLCDWFFGLILPGKVFIHRIMACLIAATPTVQSIGSSPTFESGLIIDGVSYWPKRTAVARVLGGMPNVKSVCGWIGPLPAPKDMQNCWASCPVNTPSWSPIKPLSGINGLGYVLDSRPIEATRYQYIQDDLWILPSPPTLEPNSPESLQRQVELMSLTLSSVVVTTARVTEMSLSPGSVVHTYRATLMFSIQERLVTYNISSNPLFVFSPPCIGTHVLQEWDTEAILKNAVKAVDLRNAELSAEKLLLIDALGAGEETIARAWCAEHHRNALIRKGNESCFACACNCAAYYEGFGFNVLIWAP